jgi:alkanesulfonate monooxygenase SsuD/methylene tetrahydromethanopterin reductase-like flavin-dependent oxidoreductase (luciferase family)
MAPITDPSMPRTLGRAVVSFGIFDHIDKQSQSLGATYADRLKVLELADRTGFYSYHLAEHHNTPLCMAPAPSVFLGSLAQRTTQLRFGPCVYLLPLYHPLRLAEEVCMLDHLSGGRLELGIGRGISPIELAFHGIDAAESRARFQETLDILLLALRQEHVSFNGQFHRLDNVPIEMHPIQQPHPPIWYPTSGLERVPWVAERGYNTVLIGSSERLRPVINRYWDVFSAYHSADDARPKVGVQRTIFLADSEAEAKRLAAPAFRQHYLSLIKLWQEHNMPTAAEAFTGDLDEEIAADKAYIGTPSTVRDQVARFFERSGSDYLVVRPMFGDLPLNRVLHSVGLFAHEVMPAFSSVPAPAGAVGSAR